jgi:ribosomal protein S18 acetylase RimI-like enzyme
MRLPEDMSRLTACLREAFAYPDEPQWRLPPDEQAELETLLARVQRFAPAVKLLRMLSPGFRRSIQGVICHEGEAICGFAIARRVLWSKCWILESIGVLPLFRNQGIGRELVTRVLEKIGTLGGKSVTLRVIDGNSSAQRIYSSLGFAPYGGLAAYRLMECTAPPPSRVPSGYKVQHPSAIRWRAEHALRVLTQPGAYTVFEPVSETASRRAAVFRTCALAFSFAGKCAIHRAFIVRHTASNVPVAAARLASPVAAPGPIAIELLVSQEHLATAPFLLREAVSVIAARCPGRGVKLAIPHWMCSVDRDVENLGFRKRVDYLKMGRTL